MIVRFFKLCWLAFALSACTYGQAEFQLYNTAFDVQYVEGSKVLDRLGTSERVLERRGISQSSGIADFNPDLASIYIDVGDPPLTGSLRSSLDALKKYNTALTGLTSGASANALSAQISSAITGLGGTADALGGITGTQANLAKPLASAITRVVPALQLALQARDRIQFRKQMLAAHGEMEALLKLMREGTPVMFFVMREARKTPGSLDGVDGLNSAALAGLEEDRRLLAGWVLLIDKTLIAMQSARDAVAAGIGTSDLSDLIAATVEIQAAAEAIKAAR